MYKKTKLQEKQTFYRKNCKFRTNTRNNKTKATKHKQENMKQ